MYVVISPAQGRVDGARGLRPGRRLFACSAVPGAVSGMMSRNHPRRAPEGTAAVRISVRVMQVRDDGSEVPLDGELAAALSDAAEQFAGLAGWVADESRYLDHAEREEAIMEEGRRLEQKLLQSTYKLDAALEESFPKVTSAAGTRHRTRETGHRRGPVNVAVPGC